MIRENQAIAKLSVQQEPPQEQQLQPEPPLRQPPERLRQLPRVPQQQALPEAAGLTPAR